VAEFRHGATTGGGKGNRLRRPSVPDLLPMAVLLIQHKITDLDVWLDTYANYASEREQAGVKAAHILQPDDDPHYIVVIHFFDTIDAAEAFRTFLRERVWTSTGETRGMGSEPQAMILYEVDTGKT
jgi:heme-degrading monooxygenase HmoA